MDAEWEILYKQLQKLVDAGVNVVLSKLPIGDVATQFFADRFVHFIQVSVVLICPSKFISRFSDIFCAGRVAEDNLNRTIKACGLLALFLLHFCFMQSC